MDIGSLYKTYFQNTESILFDLDGTLYNESDYLFAAYHEISIDIEKKFRILSKQVYDYLCNEFKKNGRKRLFNKLLLKFRLPENYLGEAIVILRNIKLPCKLQCHKNVLELIRVLISNHKKLFIVTNGNVSQQKNKINSIDFDGLLRDIFIIYADEHIAKPDPAVFHHLILKFGINKKTSIMVGDTNYDEQFAQATGIRFVYINDLIKC